MSRTLVDTLEAFGKPVQQLAIGEIAHGAPIAHVVQVLAGITGALAAGAITLHPGCEQQIHALIDENVAAGLCAHKLAKRHGQ